MTYTADGDTGLVFEVLPASYTDRIEFPAAPSAVRQARHWAADLLGHSDPPPCQDLIDSAVLLVSELVTNAIRAGGHLHGQAGYPDNAPISLMITREPGTVRIEVHDSACGPVPLAGDRSADAETGRGLMVIDALSRDWGWRPGRCGKVVWCELLA
ncbi:MAG TPA: ATP-binding protein [Streptosporangiaceae bacterium]|nr:ATP-binding protein [Streptosporangiaceae bacterium]